MISIAEKLTCVKCGRTKGEKEFFKMRTGNRCDICKSCLTEHIDNNKPETFKWILEKFNIPYIEKIWFDYCNRILQQKGPAAFGPASVIGQYIRSMNMDQYREYTYADSDRLNFEAKKKEQEAAAKREQMFNPEKEAELKAKLESGEISQAEYNTLSSTTYTAPAEEEPRIKNYFMEYEINENDIADKLTDEDRLYLISKWGIHYRPSEWVTMEKMYNRYAEEYELTIDREETLKKICKVSLKADQAVDAGDTMTAKNYMNMLDSLRKSAKFTEAQNKEEEVREYDTIGELVALCEREGGIIEQFRMDSDEYPQDKIDLTIKDLQAYNRNLVVNELGLGDLIESYIQKLERAEQSDQDMLDGLITTDEEEKEQLLTDQEAEDFQKFLESELEEEAEQLLHSIGEE